MMRLMVYRPKASINYSLSNEFQTSGLLNSLGHVRKRGPLQWQPTQDAGSMTLWTASGVCQSELAVVPILSQRHDSGLNAPPNPKPA
jgi:hypothetical protein